MKPPKYQSWESPRCEILKAMTAAKPMSRDLCLKCKGGRLLCGHDHCPILRKVQVQKPHEGKLDKDLFGPAPSIFVGWKGYPEVFAGPMTSIDFERPALLDDPANWYGLGFDDIILMRSQLVRSKQTQGVKWRNRYVDNLREIALAKRPTDIESHFKKKPNYSISFSPISQPMGPSAILESMRLTENPKIPKKVDYVVSDDLKSVDQTTKLFDSGYDVYYLTNVLSSGVLGLEKNQKMVPTRWSITAIDDILGKELMKKVREYPTINEYQVFTNQYLENHFEILLIPGPWEFEQFEAWAPQTLWTMSNDKPTIIQEHETFEGRTKYAINEGGGYYAGRFAAAEAMEKMKRQARIVIFREIFDTYVMPVGVWEVRENVRKAFLNKPGKFATLEQALSDINTRLRIDIKNYITKSELLRQKKITDWF